MTRLLRSRLLLITAAVLLFASACGESGETTTASSAGNGSGSSPAVAPSPETAAPANGPAPATEPAPASAPSEAANAPTAENELPDVQVVDIATGNSVNLRSFAPSATPIVLWFWAPH